MKLSLAGLVLLLAALASTRAEETVKADVTGPVEVWGITTDGILVEGSQIDYAKHPSTGNIVVSVTNGEVHRVETYLQWSGVNVQYQVKETLYVSGGSYTGWTERYLRTKTHTSFSRTVIDGAIEQEIEPDGSGFVEWTVTGGDGNDLSADTTDGTTDTATTDASSDLPTVDIEEEGEFDGVSDRRIEIANHDGDPVVTFRDDGYSRFIFDRKKLGQKIVTVTQNFQLEGNGGGDLSYHPQENTSTDSSTSATDAGTSTDTTSATSTTDTTTTDTSTTGTTGTSTDVTQ